MDLQTHSVRCKSTPLESEPARTAYGFHEDLVRILGGGTILCSGHVQISDISLYKLMLHVVIQHLTNETQ
jgi:hypothetical protein